MSLLTNHVIVNHISQPFVAQSYKLTEETYQVKVMEQKIERLAFKNKHIHFNLCFTHKHKFVTEDMHICLTKNMCSCLVTIDNKKNKNPNTLSFILNLADYIHVFF